jgi:regulator of sigma E protease
MIVITILIGLLGISLIVAIHELGHLLAAKLCGIGVESFSIGWGPKLVSFTKGGTEYRLAIFPVGGYLKMRGEEDMKTALIENKSTIVASPGSFFAAAPWKRLIVAVSGPLMNLLFAIVTLGFLFMPGGPIESPAPKIIVLSQVPEASKVYPQIGANLTGSQSPAAKAGLLTGDTILSIDGKPIANFNELAENFAQAPSLGKRSINLSVLRGDNIQTLVAQPKLDNETGQGKIGILPWEEPTIATVTAEAAQAGLLPGDRIVAIDGTKVKNSLDVDIAVSKARGSTKIDVIRNGLPKSLTAYPAFGKDGVARLPIGYVRLVTNTPALGFPQAMAKGLTETVHTLSLIVGSFRLFSQGLDVTQAVSGPIRTTVSIGQFTVAAFSTGFRDAAQAFFKLLAIISIALFFGNLLPIPALYGGQIVLYTVEWIRRKPISLKVIRRYNTIGFVLIALLFGLALVGDVLFLPHAFQ